MVDDDEELEPLFDYSRVQPDVVFLDDDDDDDLDYPRPPPPSKKMKSSVTDEEKGDKKVDKKPVEVIDCEDKIYDVDLFVLEDVSIPEEDPAIRELRLKREELASFAKSADDVLRAVEEAARKEVSALQSSPERLPEPVILPPVERNKIVISVQNKDQRKQFRVFVDDKFERFFKMYAEKVKIVRERLVFCFDGAKIGPDATPASLDMEDGDIIEVHVK